MHTQTQQEGMTMTKAKTATTDDSRYDQADAKLRATRVAYEQAVEAVSEVDGVEGRALARLRQGDTSVTASDLAAEPFVVKRLRPFSTSHTRPGSANRRPARSVRPSPSCWPPYVEKALRVEVEVVDVLTRATTAPATPTARLKQGIRAVREDGGMLSCELVELAVVRDARFKSVNFDNLRAELERAGFIVELRDRGTTGSGEVETDTAELKVVRIAPTVMPLSAAEPSRFEASKPHSAIAAEVADGVGTVDLGSPGIVTSDTPRGPVRSSRGVQDDTRRRASHPQGRRVQGADHRHGHGGCRAAGRGAGAHAGAEPDPSCRRRSGGPSVGISGPL